MERVEGAESGLFSTAQIEINYVYVKDPSVIIYPDPLHPATPSQINIPGRDQDIIIRPTATPSIATSSNIKRGGSSGGSSGGNSVVRPSKTVTVNDINSKGGVTTPEPVIDKPVINTDRI